LLESAWRYLPEDSIHLVVVDPGVGTQRRRIGLHSGGHYFVGPDNGVLSAALPEAARGLRSPKEAYEARAVAVPPGVEAVAIEDDSLFLRPLSTTFEGRDVFAPAAAHLANGGSLSELGPALTPVFAFPAFRAPVHNGRIEGVILHIDRFGNLLTDIAAEDLPASPSFAVAGRNLPPSRTYGDSAGPTAIVSSNGRIEIAVPNGSAALILGAGLRDRVIVTNAE
jgi:S-adenosylmethionine hydrolase